MKPNEIKIGDIIQLTHNCEVKMVSASELTVYDKERNLTFSIVGKQLIDSTTSGSYFSKTEKINKTDAAALLVRTHGRVFTVEFVTQDGRDRTLRGYLIGVDEHLGRSRCIDLDAPGEHKVRLVDHRTIKSLVYDGVKYVVD